MDPGLGVSQPLQVLGALGESVARRAGRGQQLAAERRRTRGLFVCSKFPIFVAPIFLSVAIVPMCFVLFHFFWFHLFGLFCSPFLGLYVCSLSFVSPFFASFPFVGFVFSVSVSPFFPPVVPFYRFFCGGGSLLDLDSGNRGEGQLVYLESPSRVQASTLKTVVGVIQPP